MPPPTYEYHIENLESDPIYTSKFRYCMTDGHYRNPGDNTNKIYFPGH